MDQNNGQVGKERFNRWGEYFLNTVVLRETVLIIDNGRAGAFAGLTTFLSFPLYNAHGIYRRLASFKLSTTRLGKPFVLGC
jgi:hypothetical protein